MPNAGLANAVSKGNPRRLTGFRYHGDKEIIVYVLHAK